MSKRTGTEMTFQEKFKDRTENMGKDGIAGIMKTTEKPVTKVEVDKMDNWNSIYNNGIIYLIQANKVRGRPDETQSNISSHSNNKIANQSHFSK